MPCPPLPRILSLIAVIAGASCSLGDSGGDGAGAREPAEFVNGQVALVYDPGYEISLFGLERLHPFDIGKYAKIHRGLIDSGLVGEEHFFRPEPITREQILLVQSEAFLQSLKSSATVARYLEAPSLRVLPARTLEQRMLRPFRRASGGTLLAARLAMEAGIAINLGGGYHHTQSRIGARGSASMPTSPSRSASSRGRASSGAPS